jgi:hypothetical protein
VSYDLCLKDPTTGEVCEANEAHDIAGGTYAVGGTPRAEFNVTYNYAKYFYRVLGDKGIRTVYGMTGADSVKVLKDAASNLRNDRSIDYWASTEGNAKQALLNMVRLAEMFPAGVWDGD